jgi:Na+-driven multidrug efflux pump
MILIPIIFHKDIILAVYGLLAISGVRWVWLIILLRRYAKWEISSEFLREHLRLATPLIITTLISGSAQYIDGVIVTTVYRDPSVFAIFRYGAKEFPLAMMLTAGLSSAMLPEFSTREKMKDALEKIKSKSASLMHILFPITMLTMFFTRWMYPRLFAPEFHVSAGVFMVYLLLVMPRIIFPHTILIGKKRTKVTMVAAFIEFALNIPLSIMMIRWGYGIVGVAVATLIVYIISRLFLVIYLWISMKIKPRDYMPVNLFLIYSALTTLLFVLIDHRIIDFH